MNLPFKGLICTIILLACKYYVCHDTAVWQGLSDEVDKVFPQHVNDCDTQLGLWYIYTLIFLYIRIPFKYTYIHIKHLLIHTWVIPLPVLVQSDSILCTVYSKESPTKNESLLAVTATGEWSPPVPGAPSLHLDKGGCFIFSLKNDVIFKFIYIHHTAAHVREMHAKLSPALPSKNNYANAPVSQCVQWILKNLGFPQRAGARCY